MCQYLKVVLTVSLLIFSCFHLFARDVRITVIDSDLDLPLEGATVRTRDGNEFICDSNGSVVIQAPQDRQIIVQAVYPGYEIGIITIPVTGNQFTINLRLSGVMQARELVIEAERPGVNETRTGRSIAVGQREISQTAEIGIIEDVMSTIKLLPGVNYTGIFNAQPSIRGGLPGDMSATLDGFYVNNPFFWGGGFSIFDPRMVHSAQLSHGVFSARYGNTISGLLEITTKNPSPSQVLFELTVNSSTTNFNLSLPLGRGGILVMGRLTYYDPVVLLAKELVDIIPQLAVANYINQAPYIRSAAISGNYRFTDTLELSATGFFGMDGLSAYFENFSNQNDILISESIIDIDFYNYQGFFISALAWNPRADMLLRFTAGTGYEETNIDGVMSNDITNHHFTPSYDFQNENIIKQSEILFNLQGRLDFDWEISNNFLVSSGIQTMFSNSESSGYQQMYYDVSLSRLSDADRMMIQQLMGFKYPGTDLSNLVISMPAVFEPETQNRLLSSSGYLLGEYFSPNNKLIIELGLRLDHFVIFGNGFTLNSDITLNPRFNIDLNLYKGTGFLQSFDISAGTGLFSSIDSNVFSAEERFNIDQIKPNRSWTSILGMRFEFSNSLSLNIEGYYKYVFDRTYIPVAFGIEDLEINPSFDGEGHIWGIDVMLHKVQSRFWDGWLSYSFNWSRYRDPQGRYGGLGFSGGRRGDDWYYPSYHRFHYLNLVLNIKPVQNINIYFRFGLASGQQLSRRVTDAPGSRPVLIYDPNNPLDSQLIQKFYWDSVIDENNRTTPSLPMDIKFSIFGSNRNGRARYEVYLAVENVLSLLYNSQGNTSFNQYTGQIDTGSNSASYELPFPVPSFGFKFSF